MRGLRDVFASERLLRAMENRSAIVSLRTRSFVQLVAGVKILLYPVVLA